MIRVELAPTWRIVSNGQVREMDLPLIAILGDLAESGKLTHAARVAGISHRHARNLIIGWGDFLGSPLVVMQRGRGTSLTLLGERVLWAGRRIESRLAPELDGLAGDFARGINQALGTTVQSLVIHASHDFAVALLRERLQAEGISVELQSQGSFDALASLLRAECVIAGFHVPEGRLGGLMAARYAEILAGHDIRMLPLARRSQGLIIPRGNPQQVMTVSDLAKPGVRFVNRQRGSGTRALLESLLSESRIDRRSITGYDNEEITHSAVAALVAGRQADAGFGVKAAAARFGLDFVPIVAERYYLAVSQANASRDDVKAMVAVASAPGFRDEVDAIPGYESLRGTALIAIRDAIGASRANASTPR